MTCWLCGFNTTELATNPKAPICENGPCQICIAVANTDKEIDQAVGTLLRLLAKHSDLRSEKNRVHRSPIQQLPVELKSYIFELLVVPSRNEWGQILRIGPRLSAGIGVLWSTMHISIGTHASMLDPFGRIKIVRDWLQRSRTLLLTLHIVGHPGFLKGSKEESKGIIGVINQCSDRWHSLSLNIPSELFCAFHPNNFQCRPLKKFRVIGTLLYYTIDRPVAVLDSTVSPVEIELRQSGISFRSLQISWNQLSTATVDFCLEDILQPFRHASQMTYCHIVLPECFDDDPPMSPIIHQRLEILRLSGGRWIPFLGCLTLPRLQQFYSTDLFPIQYLPALVHRSSCPLTRITFDLSPIDTWSLYLELFDNMQPLPGVTDLVVNNIEGVCQIAGIKKFLLEEYFPDLRHLILQQDSFYVLRDEDVIPLLLDWKRLLPPNKMYSQLLAMGNNHKEDIEAFTIGH